MHNTIYALEKLLPEAIKLFKERSILLQTILENGPIGRRGLAHLLNVSERTIRKEVDFFAKEGFIQISHQGITITSEAERLLDMLYLPLQMLEQFTELETTIENLLNLKQAIIVKGDVEVSETVKNQLGRACSNLLISVLQDGMTMAIAGGTTVSKMVEVMPKKHNQYKHLTIIPARGSVGNQAEIQANTVAVELAKKLGAAYELFTLPDNLSSPSIDFIKNEPQIQAILQKMSKTDIILFGIGNAFKMAKGRNESQEVLDILTQKQAVAEVFRHYFDAQGQVVYHTQSIGISPELAQDVPVKIAVAGGASKAQAILAIRDLLRNSYLIIDEAAAREIIKNMI